MKRPQYTDVWQRTGRSYIPAAHTDVRATIKRIQREQRVRDLPDIFKRNDDDKRTANQ